MGFGRDSGRSSSGQRRVSRAGGQFETRRDALRRNRVVVCDAAKDGPGDEPALWPELRLPRRQPAGMDVGDVVNALVRPRFVVVADELGDGPAELSLREEDEAAQALAPQGPHEALHVRRRVRCAVRDGDARDAEGSGEPPVQSGAEPTACRAGHLRPELAEDAVVVVEKEAGRGTPGGSVAKLLLEPGQRRRRADGGVHDPPAVQGQDHENVAGLEVPHDLGGEVERPDLAGVACQEGLPGRAAGRLVVDHVPADRARIVLGAQLEVQLEHDAVLAPLGVVGGDAADELDALARDPRPARLAAGAPAPVELVASAVPAQHGVGLDDEQRGSPPGPVPAEPDPEGPVAAAQLRALHLALQDRELLAERDDLAEEVGAGAGSVEEGREHGQEGREHSSRFCIEAGARSTAVRRIGFSRSTGVERAIKSVRLELLNHIRVEDIEELQWYLDEYRTYYNEHRANQATGGQTPAEFGRGTPVCDVIGLDEVRQRRLVRKSFAHGLLNAYELADAA